MASLNKVILVGNVGKIETKEVTGDKGVQKVVSLSMATNEYDAKSENKQRTEWHNVVVFGKTAEFTSNFVNKGSSIIVEGKIRTRDWIDSKTNEKRYKTEIIADKLELLSKSSEKTAREESSHVANYETTSTFQSSSTPADDDDMPF